MKRKSAYIGMWKFKFSELKAVSIFALVFAALSWILLLPENIMLAYVLVTFLLGFFIAEVALAVRKAGSVLIFMTLSSVLSLGAGTIGIEGWKKIAAFIAAGLIFELLYLLLGFRSDKIEIIFSGSLSCASVPFIIGLLLSWGMVRDSIWSMLNLSLISFIIGFIGSAAAVLVWEKIKNKKIFVKIRYAP